MFGIERAVAFERCCVMSVCAAARGEMYSYACAAARGEMYSYACASGAEATARRGREGGGPAAERTRELSIVHKIKAPVLTINIESTHDTVMWETRERRALTSDDSL